MARFLLFLLFPSVVAAAWKASASIVSQPPVADAARPSITHPCDLQAARRPRKLCDGPKELYPLSQSPRCAASLFTCDGPSQQSRCRKCRLSCLETSVKGDTEKSTRYKVTSRTFRSYLLSSKASWIKPSQTIQWKWGRKGQRQSTQGRVENHSLCNDS